MGHDRQVLKVGGDDRAKFLNDLLTVEVSDALRYGALLSPQGKILSDLFVWGDGEAHFLDLPASEYDAVKAKLSMYKLRADVVLEDTDLKVVQSDEGGNTDPRHEGLGCRAYGNADAEGVGADDYLARRIHLRIPEFGIDFGANEAYPIEWRFGAMNGIDYTKGCYVGQEIAARMRHKTELKKTIYHVQFEGEIAQGEEILVGGKPVGKMLSSVDGAGLAFLRVAHADKDLSAGGVKLTVKELA